MDLLEVSAIQDYHITVWLDRFVGPSFLSVRSEG